MGYGDVSAQRVMEASYIVWMNSFNGSTKSETEFRFFGCLPPEIRRQIYILATPPRVVLVEEDGRDSEEWEWKRDEFTETCRTTPIQFKVHPEIAYFAHNWCPEIGSSLRSHTQRTLEAYGFTSTARRYQPWVPTEHVPEIPSTWLADHPNHAWDLTRSACLSSCAPIPPFLHVCNESRETLKSYGYQLSFGTRTHGPRTWFHFERDTLYIRHNYSGEPELLSGATWDVGLFRPADLLRVKRLALKDGSWIASRVPAEISNILRLIPNLNDLFLVQWDHFDIAESLFGCVCNLQPIDPGDHSVCVRIDEADFIPSIASYRIDQDKYTYNRLKSFKIRHKQGLSPGQPSYFDYEAIRCRQTLYNVLRGAISRTPDLKSRRWNVPQVKFTLVCSREMADRFFTRRHRFWNRFLDTKNRLAQGKRSKLDGLKGKFDTSTEFQDPDEYESWEFHYVHHRMYDCWYREDFTLPVTRDELWWLTEATVSPPRYDIL
ncbi:hypothetical protein F5Y13DRAFT_182948 [Hypoxylon sp. FL1857]|nr:hypothetical protein F5Y13DRAFT_182948 [Hypoxylon sp. FL1857]